MSKESTEKKVMLKTVYKVGTKVTFHTPFTTEKGIIKEITENCIFVVFKCGELWSYYINYPHTKDV